MKTFLDCVPCVINSFLNLLKTSDLPQARQQEAMSKLLAYLAQMDYEKSPPVIGQETHRIIRRELGVDDPYREVKRRYNQMMMEMLPTFEAMIEESDDPFEMALRLAIAGNVIDFGPQNQLDFMGTIERVVHAPIAVDDSSLLRQDLAKAKSVLYIGDNCGEIVFDRLFLERIPVKEKYFAVRGAPVINDATYEDAVMVGIDAFAKIVFSGDDIPGAVWGALPQDFEETLLGADVVISKGQGNLEGMIDAPRDIYFLLTVKCDLVGGLIGARTGDFVVKKKVFDTKSE